MDRIIQVNSLKKSYGSVEAVKDISFYVERGGLFAFLGPNGAGKSTTIDIICTFLKPDGGEVIIDGLTLGRDDEKIRGLIGVVFQDGLLDRLLTVEQNLRVRGSFYGLRGKELNEAVKNTASMCGITDILKRQYGRLSGGQRRRCDIARALINTPKILFLDEPTTGLDPKTRRMVWDIIVELQKTLGMTVFLTTHYMEEAAGADYVIVIDEGKISAKGTPAELKDRYSKDRLILSAKDMDTLCSKLDKINVSYTVTADSVTIETDGTMSALPVLDVCRDHIYAFEVLKGTMDDAFLAITKKENDDA